MCSGMGTSLAARHCKNVDFPHPFCPISPYLSSEFSIISWGAGGGGLGVATVVVATTAMPDYNLESGIHSQARWGRPFRQATQTDIAPAAAAADKPAVRSFPYRTDEQRTVAPVDGVNYKPVVCARQIYQQMFRCFVI